MDKFKKEQLDKESIENIRRRIGYFNKIAGEAFFVSKQQEEKDNKEYNELALYLKERLQIEKAEKESN